MSDASGSIATSDSPLLGFPPHIDPATICTASRRPCGARNARLPPDVIAFDVLRSHDAGDDELVDLEVDADFLPAFDHHVVLASLWRGDDTELETPRLLTPRSRGQALS